MKATIVALIAVGVLVLGTSLLGGNDIEIENEPVVELTSEQKFEEARNLILSEIKELEVEKQAIEEKIKAKEDLLD